MSYDHEYALWALERREVALRKSEPKPALKAYAVVWAALVVVGLIALVRIGCPLIDQFYYGGA